MNTAGVPIPKFNFFNSFSRLSAYRELQSLSMLFRCCDSYNFEVDPNRSAASNYKPVVVKKDSIIEVLPS